MQVQVMKIQTHLPDDIHAFRYVKNSHYIELEDSNKNVIKLVAKSMVKGVCTKCNETIWAETRSGLMRCPHCVSNVKWVWGKAQLVFVPEEESEFTSPIVGEEE